MLIRVSAVLGLVWAFATPMAAQSLPDCDGFDVDASEMSCFCPRATKREGAVWGVDIFTSDSNICAAAQHAGVIGPPGGRVTVYGTAGLQSYDGGTSRGVTTQSYGAYSSSFTFDFDLVESGASETATATPDQQDQPAPQGAPNVPATPGEIDTSLRFPRELDPNIALCGSFVGAGDQVTCRCDPGEVHPGAVWGTDFYTEDSNICAAARHQAQIGPEGGIVTVFREDGLSRYQGSSRNGVNSSDWGAYGSSFVFSNGYYEAAASGAAPVAPPTQLALCSGFPSEGDSVECMCPGGSRTGSVWGAGPYTSDSDLCAAAQHSGVIGSEGGPVTAYRFQGLPGYRGTAQNGVTSQDWGAYSESFVIDTNK